MTAVGEKSMRRMDGLLLRILFIILCFFGINFLSTYVSVAQVTLAVPGGAAFDLSLPSFSTSWHRISSAAAAAAAGAADGNGDGDGQQSISLGDRGLSRRTSLRMYVLSTPFTSTQLVGVFRNLCYNGSHVLTIGPSVACEEDGLEPAHALPAYSPLRRQACNDSSRLALYQGMLARENGLPFDARDEDWFFSRGDNITWETGLSSFIYLDRSTANCAHFLGKVNAILLTNGATIPTFRDVVRRFYFVLHPSRREQQWVPGRGNDDGFLPTYLAGALNRVLSPFSDVKELRSSDLLASADELQIVAARGRVRLGGQPFMEASEDSPLCFDQALVPGVLKEGLYPSGKPVPQIVRQHFRAWLDIQRGEKEAPVLAYIRRDGRRRVFLQESEHSFTQLLQTTEGFAFRSISFSNMSFREQFRLAQEADVSISLHGANLVNPSMLSRGGSILIELHPFRALHRMYETQSLQSGLVYFGHQLDQATPQKLDKKFHGLSYPQCMTKAPECKENFLHRRNVELTEDDLLQIQTVLAIARRIYWELTLTGVTADASPQLFGPRLLQIVREEAEMDTSCAPYLTAKDDLCRNTWVAFSDQQGSPHICYISKRCQLPWTS